MSQEKTPLDFVNYATVERAYKNCIVMQKQSSQGRKPEREAAERYAKRGMRAAKAKDLKLMLVLEQATDVLLKVSNKQLGQYRYRSDIPFSHTVEPTEVQLWREAYRMADEGTPLENFRWIYGAAAELAFGR
jgi:hypothetical protein